jgi:peptidoglycan lytic transglycosylase
LIVRDRVISCAVVSASALLLAPATGLAASGGSGLGPAVVNQTKVSPPPVPLPGSTIDTVQPGAGTVSATGHGITIASPVSGLLQNQMKFTGSVPATVSRSVVEIERLGQQTNWTWAPTAHAMARANGSFTVVWRANHIGRFQIRAVAEGTGDAGAASASPTVTTIVYRPAIATQYGPGLYGNTTACGEVLRQGTLGTANRTLPCGTLVALYYRGRTMVVPVIDRGPYANGADWDLTEATGRALGIPGTATIGAVSLPPEP